MEARLVLRARIVLAATEGRENKEIAAELGTLRKTVGLWRQRFAHSASDDHQIAKDDPRRRQTHALRRGVATEVFAQVDPSVFAERRDRFCPVENRKARWPDSRRSGDRWHRQ